MQFLRGARLIQREGEQIAIGRFAPRLARKPVEERSLDQLGIEPALTPVVTHVGTEIRQHVLLECLTRQLPFRLTLFVV